MNKITLCILVLLLSINKVNGQKINSPKGMESVMQIAAAQYSLQTDSIEKTGKVMIPRTYHDNKVRYTGIEDWVSGFYAGSIWYLYQLTQDQKWLTLAQKYTGHLEPVKSLKWHHDIGFMIGCSFGNGWQITKDTIYKSVIIEAAKSLSTRYRPNAGVIQSWNVDRGWQSKRGWECPVIIDNMMNLELLFLAAKLSNDSTFYNIAISHADNTLKHHYRPDNSCYHVIDYSVTDGRVRNKHTAQGYAHESSWARGQAWGIYGFIVCYRETGDKKYLRHAEEAFQFVWKHSNIPADKVPYWDFNAPKIPDEPRDASSAAIMASALYEMHQYTGKKKHKKAADKLINSLSSSDYLAEVGSNGNFLLMHSVGSIPHNSEIDVPLNYADYYFLEALVRKWKLESGERF